MQIKKLVPKIIFFKEYPCIVSVLREDTISYMRDTDLLNIVLIRKCLFC